MENPKQPEAGNGKLPEILSILPLFDTTLFPKMVLPLVVMQKDSIRLVDEAMSKDRIIGLIATKEKKKESENPADKLYSYGTCALILKMAKVEDDKAQLLVQGLSRFRVVEYAKTSPYMEAKVEYITDFGESDTEIQALMSNMVSLFGRIVELSPGLPQEMGQMVKSVQEPGILADMVASIINSNLEEKQKILETLDIKKRLQEVTLLANHQLEILELGNKIQTQVKGDMDKSQREYYLRQQLKA
ncbi:MAG: LON peptidase substrate-binding domain-containing protein, partial [Proteobacteria bacterium]|nr:LON peptidase substrate-binding domain-containing protein [Pseudomonadota bacterium]